MVHRVAGDGRAYCRSNTDRGSDGSKRKVEPPAPAHDIGNNQRDKNPEHGGRNAIQDLDGDHDARIPYHRKQRAARRQCRKAEDQ